MATPHNSRTRYHSATDPPAPKMNPSSSPAWSVLNPGDRRGTSHQLRPDREEGDLGGPRRSRGLRGSSRPGLSTGTSWRPRTPEPGTDRDPDGILGNGPAYPLLAKVPWRSMTASTARRTSTRDAANMATGRAATSRWCRTTVLDSRPRRTPADVVARQGFSSGSDSVSVPLGGVTSPAPVTAPPFHVTRGIAATWPRRVDDRSELRF